MVDAVAPAPRSGARLLLGELRPERRALTGVGALLTVAVGLPVIAQLLLGAFVDEADDGAGAARLTRLALGFAVLLLTANALRLLVTWLSVRLAWRVGNRLRTDLCRHALGLDLAWHGEHRAGEVIERVDGDIEAVTRFTSTAVLEVIGNVAVLLAVAVTALLIEWRIGVVLLVTVGVAIGVLVRLRDVAVPSHDHEREVLSHLYGDLEDRLGGLEDIRANGAGPWATDRLHRHSARWWRAARRASLRGEGAYAATAVTFAFGTATTLGASALLVSRGQLTLGGALVMFRFVQMVHEPLDRIGEQLNESQKAIAGVQRAARLLGTESALRPGTDVLPDGALAVELDGVGLLYRDDARAPGDDPPDGDAVSPAPEATTVAEEHDLRALVDVDLVVPAGSSLGLVGRTGSGKSSLGRLLARFWDPTSGVVRIGGLDLRDVDAASLRARVAVVTQEVEVLRATVRDNLTMFGTVPAGDERLISVLTDVGLDRWLGDLPAGLDSEIDGAEQLSGGEAQLLAFARVLLADPGLVLLDEATSRLDPDTEARLAVATRRLREGRTLVVIAHRLATLDDLDAIAVVDDGRVVEHGPRADLVADPASRFARLLATQRAASSTGSTASPGARP